MESALCAREIASGSRAVGRPLARGGTGGILGVLSGLALLTVPMGKAAGQPVSQPVSQPVGQPDKQWPGAAMIPPPAAAPAAIPPAAAPSGGSPFASVSPASPPPRDSPFSAALSPASPPPRDSLSSAALSPASAPPRGSPFALRLAVDLPLTLGAGVLALTTEVVKSELPGPACASGCDPAGINPLDRLSLGSHSGAARTTSDVLVGVQLGLPFALDLIDVLVSHPPDGWRGYGADVLVLAEVLAVNVGLDGLVKNAVRRPRPLVYDADLVAVPAADRTAPDAALSFYSEHSSTAFAMATAYSYLFMRRHPGSRLVAPVWVIAEALATTTAALRVAAGKHFITDVLTGAVVGSALGVLIPYLHLRAGPAEGRAWARRLSVTPLAYRDGGGLLLTVQ